MNGKLALAASLAPAALALCGCEHSVFSEPGDSRFGEANRQTTMAQVVDPEPHYPAPAAGDGGQAERAIDAYRKGTVDTSSDVSDSAISGSLPK